MRVYADGNYKSLSEGESQGGQKLFLEDKKSNFCPIWWSSTKLKRVVNSALAAETLSMYDGCDMALYLSELLLAFKTQGIEKSTPQIVCVTDSQSLFKAVASTNLVGDKRLRVEISALQQMVNNSQVHFRSVIHLLREVLQLSFWGQSLRAESFHTKSKLKK